jgi:hypothetical protein
MINTTALKGLLLRKPSYILHRRRVRTTLKDQDLREHLGSKKRNGATETQSAMFVQSFERLSRSLGKGVAYPLWRRQIPYPCHPITFNFISMPKNRPIPRFHTVSVAEETDLPI